MTTINNGVLRRSSAFPLLILLLAALNPSSASSSPNCSCAEYKEKYETLSAKYEKQRSNAVLDMKQFLGDKSCSLPMKQLEESRAELLEANKQVNNLKKRSDAFTTLLMAVLNDRKHHADASLPKFVGKCNNVTTFSCSTRQKESISLCLWEQTKHDGQPQLIMIDRETVQSRYGSAMDEILHTSNATALDEGKCGLTLRVSTSGRVSHWSCTLITEDRDVFYATVKVKEPNAHMVTCKASSLSFTVSHVFIQLSLLYQFYITMK